MLLYIVEIIVFIIVICIEIILKKKGKLQTLNYILGTILAFLIIFLSTYFFEKPKMDLKNYETIEVNSQLTIPKTTYHFQDVTDKVHQNGEVEISKLGEYEVEFELDIMSGKYSKKQKIKVLDTTAPNIDLKGEEDFELSYNEEYQEPGFTAIDAYEGDLTDKVNVSKEDINENEYQIVYEVEDSSGNKMQKTRHIKIVDNVEPTIQLNGNINIYMNIGNEYQELGATAIDEKDGDISNSIKTEGSVDTSKEGIYTITYKVTDKFGNEAVISRYVMVANAGRVIPQDGTNGEKGVIYLTFDDGPSTTITPQILDILKKKGVKATFFVLNYNGEIENLIKREYEEGHTVAIHGYSHNYSTIYKSIDSYLNNIAIMQEKLKNTLGTYITITRFPGGSSNTVSRKYCPGIMTSLCYEMVNRGYTYFDWNVDSDDAGHAKTSDDVYRNVTSRLSKEQSNVVLMHDFSGNTKTLNALEAIIDYGLENGYTFEPITNETQMVTHETNN